MSHGISPSRYSHALAKEVYRSLEVPGTAIVGHSMWQVALSAIIRPRPSWQSSLERSSPGEDSTQRVDGHHPPPLRFENQTDRVERP
jgi:hypothetical protein